MVSSCYKAQIIQSYHRLFYLAKVNGSVDKHYNDMIEGFFKNKETYIYMHWRNKGNFYTGDEKIIFIKFYKKNNNSSN